MQNSQEVLKKMKEVSKVTRQEGRGHMSHTVRPEIW